MSTPESGGIEIYPATPERWDDLERLFGPRGATGGCWCMWWRLPRSEFERQNGEGNREALRSLVYGDDPPGLLAYINGQPVGWCAIAPREQYGALERSRILKRVDEQSVWSVTCFFVAKEHRRKGVTSRLLRAAVEYAAEHGARLVEGYPVEPKSGDAPPVFIFTGIASSFRDAGFAEVARRSETRPILRYQIAEK
jgi:GNAT superfamily N-acetyltransferase